MWRANAAILVVLCGLITAIGLDTKPWPFNNYPMFAHRVRSWPVYWARGDVAAHLALIPVGVDGEEPQRERALEARHLAPQGTTAMMMAFNKMLGNWQSGSIFPGSPAEAGVADLRARAEQKKAVLRRALLDLKDRYNRQRRPMRFGSPGTAFFRSRAANARDAGTSRGSCCWCSLACSWVGLSFGERGWMRDDGCLTNSRGVTMTRVVEREMWKRVLPAVLLPLVPWLVLKQPPFESAKAQTSTQESARAVIERSCLHCHGKENNSGLDMRRRENLLKGGARGPAVVPGRPEASLLYLAATHDDVTDLEMPFGGDRLAEEDLEILHQWIRAGAPWNDIDLAVDYQAPSWWSFKPPTRSEVPDVEETTWVTNPIDAFVLAKLEEKGLPHAPPAARRTLMRRAYFDLIGLPPTPEEVETFVDDPAEDAYRKLITKLLDSPHYGERWGRHWLDVVRYADSTGFESDEYFPYAWRYRDYVIKSFNEDKPYDRFVQEQIAADEIWPDDLDTQGGYSIPPRKLRHLEARVGTGLYALGPVVGESKMNEATLTSENLTDWVDVTGAAFMGATLACARCHDHKFDPISQ